MAWLDIIPVWFGIAGELAIRQHKLVPRESSYQSVVHLLLVTFHGRRFHYFQRIPESLFGFLLLILVKLH